MSDPNQPRRRRSKKMHARNKPKEQEKKQETKKEETEVTTGVSETVETTSGPADTTTVETPNEDKGSSDDEGSDSELTETVTASDESIFMEGTDDLDQVLTSTTDEDEKPSGNDEVNFAAPFVADVVEETTTAVDFSQIAEEPERFDPINQVTAVASSDPQVGVPSYGEGIEESVEEPEPEVDPDQAVIDKRMGRFLGFVENIDTARRSGKGKEEQLLSQLITGLRFELGKDPTDPLNRKILKAIKELFIKHKDTQLSHRALGTLLTLGDRSVRDEASWLYVQFRRLAIGGRNAPDPDWSNHRRMVKAKFADRYQASLRRVTKL